MKFLAHLLYSYATWSERRTIIRIRRSKGDSRLFKSIERALLRFARREKGDPSCILCDDAILIITPKTCTVVPQSELKKPSQRLISVVKLRDIPEIAEAAKKLQEAEMPTETPVRRFIVVGLALMITNFVRKEAGSAFGIVFSNYLD